MRKELNSQMIFLVHQHGRRFIVLGHQYGRRENVSHDVTVTILVSQNNETTQYGRRDVM